MSQSEWHNPLKNCELVCSSYYFKWPKVADAVIEAHYKLRIDTLNRQAPRFAGAL
jgi:hypothetical protein